MEFGMWAWRTQTLRMCGSVWTCHRYLRHTISIALMVTTEHGCTDKYTSFQCCAVRHSHKATRPRVFIWPASARTTLSNKLEPFLPETKTAFSQQTLLFVYCFSLTNFAETSRRRSFYRSLIEYDFAIRGNLSRRCMHCHDVTLFIDEYIHGECIRQTFIDRYCVWHVGDGLGCGAVRWELNI